MQQYIQRMIVHDYAMRGMQMRKQCTRMQAVYVYVCECHWLDERKIDVCGRHDDDEGNAGGWIDGSMGEYIPQYRGIGYGTEWIWT